MVVRIIILYKMRVFFSESDSVILIDKITTIGLNEIHSLHDTI